MKKYYQLHKSSLTKNKVANLKELWDKKKSQGYEGLTVEVKTEFKKSASDDNKFHATFSTAAVDRHGDIVVQKWELKNFKKNPVYLDSHNYSSIVHILGKIEKIKNDDTLHGDIVFAMKNPKGVLARDLAADGFLNTSSVGFIPLEFDDKFEKITRSELLEISAVSVPANPEATYDKKDAKSKTKDVISNEGGEPNNDDNKEGREEIEETEETEETPKVKTTPFGRIKLATQKEVDIRNHALTKILTAIKLVSEETQGRNSSNEDRAGVNSKINKAVRTLLKMKIN